MLLRDGYARNSHEAAGTTIVLAWHIEGGGVLGTMTMKPGMMVILVLLLRGLSGFRGKHEPCIASSHSTARAAANSIKCRVGKVVPSLTVPEVPSAGLS